MRGIVCTILPVGHRVAIPAEDDGTVSRERAAGWLADCTGLQPGSFDFLSRQDGGLKLLDDSVIRESIFALVRVRAGGKGGFRKQLEKKGREFSRAKAKQDRAKKSESKSGKYEKKHDREGRPGKAVVVESPTRPKVVFEDAVPARQLAAQGVAVALSKFIRSRKPN